VTYQTDQADVRNAMIELNDVVKVVHGEDQVQHNQGEHGQLHGVAQEGHVTHQIDQDEVRNGIMQLQEDVGVVKGEVDVQHVQGEHVQGEVHVQHVQGEHGQLRGVALEGHVTHQIDQDEVRNARMQLQEDVRVVQGEVYVQHVQDTEFDFKCEILNCLLV
jgi:hypothetical protein